MSAYIPNARPSMASGTDIRGVMLALSRLAKGRIWWLLPGLVVVAIVWLALHLPQTIEAQAGAFDTPSGYPVPRWVTIRSSKVYARKGPSKDHDVLWVYTQKGLPVQVISETREWRLICDPEGAIAWVRHDMVSARRAVMASSSAGVDLHVSPNEKSGIGSRLKPNALATLDKCEKGYCRVKLGRGGLGSGGGWAAQSSLWGTQAAAACKR